MTPGADMPRKIRRARTLALFAFAVFMAGITAIVVYAAHRYGGAVRVVEVPVYEDWRPPIGNCPDNVERWECMRHAMWREDL